MMCSDYLPIENRDEFFQNHDEDADGDNYPAAPRWLVYNNPVILHAPNFRYRPAMIALLNREGFILSGSNIYTPAFREAGGLCLGDSFDPMSAQPIELLTTNQANRDLMWTGMPIQGKWETSGEFTASSWPAISTQFEVPQQISVDLDAWSQS